MTFILKAKHWQIFPFVALFFFVMLLFPIVFIFNLSIAVILIGITLWLLCYVGYLLLVGLATFKVTKQKKGLDYAFFLVGTIYSLLYSILFGLVLSGLTVDLGLRIDFTIILPFHLLAMAANFNALRFSAKTLVFAEKQAKPLISEYILEFILFWFIPIGIWFLQPRLNKLGAAA